MKRSDVNTMFGLLFILVGFHVTVGWAQIACGVIGGLHIVAACFNAHTEYRK